MDPKAARISASIATSGLKNSSAVVKSAIASSLRPSSRNTLRAIAHCRDSRSSCFSRRSGPTSRSDDLASLTTEVMSLTSCRKSSSVQEASSCKEVSSSPLATKLPSSLFSSCSSSRSSPPSSLSTSLLSCATSSTTEELLLLLLLFVMAAAATTPVAAAAIVVATAVVPQKDSSDCSIVSVQAVADSRRRPRRACLATARVGHGLTGPVRNRLRQPL
mmetsp:Transcript_69930/g.134936  ORF Transcript_69930/g.134936 Transcript_69930/m.134936 type:complete len:218 (-) Transcript_69930:241-894(-)